MQTFVVLKVVNTATQ